MKVAIIAPIPHLKYTQLGTMHMALAHLVLKSSAYSQFYKNESMFKILDNGTFEGEPIPFEKVLTIAELINAQEIVLPDIMYDSKQTVQLADNTMGLLMKKGLLTKYRWLGVVQGRTEEEWWDCFHYFNHHPHISTIGINKLSTPLAFGGTTANARLHVTKYLEEEGYVKQNKAYHLLGGSYEIVREVHSHPSWVRSIDSSAPIIYGGKGISLTRPNIKAVKGPVDFDRSIAAIYEPCIIENIQAIVREA